MSDQKVRYACLSFSLEIYLGNNLKAHTNDGNKDILLKTVHFLKVANNMKQECLAALCRTTSVPLHYSAYSGHS